MSKFKWAKILGDCKKIIWRFEDIKKEALKVSYPNFDDVWNPL